LHSDPRGALVSANGGQRMSGGGGGGGGAGAVARYVPSATSVPAINAPTAPETPLATVTRSFADSHHRSCRGWGAAGAAGSGPGSVGAGARWMALGRGGGTGDGATSGSRLGSGLGGVARAALRSSKGPGWGMVDLFSHGSSTIPAVSQQSTDYPLRGAPHSAILPLVRRTDPASRVTDGTTYNPAKTEARSSEIRA